MEFKLNNFIGQDKIKKQLSLFIFPALEEEKHCDHILLEGTPGTGKTTLAEIIATENNLGFKKVIAPIIKNKSDLISLFCDIEEGTIIFFDEVHRLDVAIEEMLYQIMDEKKLNITMGKDGDSRFVTIDIPTFTIIAATTLSGLLSKPFKDRFGFRFYMSDYSADDIQQIITNNLKKPLSKDILNYVTSHSKNIPRLAINITKRINDYQLYLKRDLTKDDIMNVLDLLGYKFGLNRHDLEYLEALKTSGPLSIDTLSKKLTIEKVNITSDIEPYLLKKSYIELNSRGRNITTQGIKLLKEIL